MAQDVNAPHRGDHKDDEDWFDLQSLAPGGDPLETPMEVWSARKARAYYAPATPQPDTPDTPSPLASPPFDNGPGFLDTYGPSLYFAFLALIAIAGVVLLVWTPSAPSPEQRAVEAGAQAEVAPPTPTVVDRGTTPALPVRPPTSFRVDSDPEGAYVYVDGALAGITPYRDDTIESGWRTVVLALGDHAERDTLVYVDPEAVTTLTLALDPLPEDPITAAPEPPTPPRDESAQPTTEATATVQKAGELQVETTPARAVVHLDGKAVGRTPLLLGDLSPGTYEVTLSLPGFAPHARRVDVGPGRRSSVNTALAALTGTVSVLVHPWGSIYVDGELLARDTDLRRSIDVAVGTHVVRVEHPALGVQERTVEVRAGQTTTVDFDLL